MSFYFDLRRSFFTPCYIYYTRGSMLGGYFDEWTYNCFNSVRKAMFALEDKREIKFETQRLQHLDKIRWFF